MDPAQPSNPEADLKKLEEELDSFGKPSQEQPIAPQTPTPPVTETAAPIPKQPPTPWPEPTQPPPPPSTPPAPKPSGSKIMLVALGLLALSLIGVGAYFFATNRGVSGPTQTPYVAAPTPGPTANWRTITRKYASFKVPADWYYLECDDKHLYLGTEYSTDETKECNFEAVGTVLVYREKPTFVIPVDLVDPTTKEPVFRVLEKKDIEVDGLSAVWQKEEVSRAGESFIPRIAVYIKATEGVDIIYLTDLSQEETFNLILSTFKFIEATPSVSPTATPKTTPTITPSATPY